MSKTPVSKTGRMVGMAIFIAIVAVLTVIATFVKFGSFPITLTLIPIVVGAAIYGPASGAVLGSAFGIMVLIFCITGADPGGFVLWGANPAMTAVLCIAKGAAAGFIAGHVYLALGKKNAYLGAVCAAVVAPVVNTGIFIAGMFLFFYDTLAAWAGGTSIVFFALIGLTGINFVIEMIVNIVLAPAVVRIIKAAAKT